MFFEKYQHIERIDSAETSGLLDGICHIFPKIDGTNGQIWWDDGIKAGSRNRILTLDYDNAGFYNAAIGDRRYDYFFTKYRNLRLYGEWLVPHTLKTYRDDAWRKFYVFDVMDGEKYLPYEEYKPLLDECGIDYIVPICLVENPTENYLYELLDKNQFLIKDNEGVGEGIVIKNYNFVNRFGRTTWGKIVRTEFKEKLVKEMGVPRAVMKQGPEQAICEKYVTETLIDKELAKIKLENDGFWDSKLIPKLFGVVYYSLVTEEIWNMIKTFKSPTIDFKRLNKLAILEIKKLKPELF